MNDTLQQFIYNPISHTVDKSWLCLIPAIAFAMWSFARRKRSRLAGVFARWAPRLTALIWFAFPVYQGWTRRVSDYGTVRVDLVVVELFILPPITLAALVACWRDLAAGKRKVN
jgi:hypothetical protein